MEVFKKRGKPSNDAKITIEIPNSIFAEMDVMK